MFLMYESLSPRKSDVGANIWTVLTGMGFIKRVRYLGQKILEAMALNEGTFM
jgi:hypothetical protein